MSCESKLAVHQHLALLDVLTLEHVDVTKLRNQRFIRFTFGIGDDQALLALGFLAERYGTGHFRENCRLLRLARFEQIGNARQTTGDVAVLGGFLRDLGEHIADLDLGTVFDVDEGAARQHVVHRDIGSGVAQYVALAIHQFDCRAQFLTRIRANRIFHNLDGGQTGHFINTMLNGNRFDEVENLTLPATSVMTGCMCGSQVASVWPAVTSAPSLMVNSEP